MANLYHRNLLTEFEAIDIEQELIDAITYLNKQPIAGLNDALKGSLLSRLEFRRELLSAVRIDEIVNRQRASFWERCLELLPAIQQTTRLGVPMEESFSMKIQRRLASSVPPRPMVNINFEDAYAFLNRLCQHGKEAYRILDYYGGCHLLVCKCCIFHCSNANLGNISADFRLGVPISDPTAFCVHKMLASVSHIQRDESARDHVIQETFVR